MKTALLIMACLLSVYLLGSYKTTPDLDSGLKPIVKPHRFSIAGWESSTLLNEVKQAFSGTQHETVDNEIQTVIEYFSTTERIKASGAAAENTKASGYLASLEAELSRLQGQKMALEDTVEGIIEKQVRETLAEQGIFNPINSYVKKLTVSFPPVSFKLGKLPYLLVISPRDRIESIRRITLQPDTGLKTVETIEANADKLGVSSLVVGLGGLSTYPSFVTNEASLRFTIDAVVEEWLHQYLAFKPLGFLYLLDTIGISRNYEIATMNETLVGIVSKEIGAIVCEKYYSETASEAEPKPTTGTGFDFNGEMRETRKTVDIYLAQGEIEKAEAFMEQKRQYLVSMGYHIRKLNQAYFAFYGCYADSPTSISPIGAELKELRSRSASLKDFLNTVASMTSREDLRLSLK